MWIETDPFVYRQDARNERLRRFAIVKMGKAKWSSLICHDFLDQKDAREERRDGLHYAGKSIPA